MGDFMQDIKIYDAPSARENIDKTIVNDDMGVLSDFIMGLRNGGFQGDLDIFYYKQSKLKMQELDFKLMRNGIELAKYSCVHNLLYYIKEYFKDAVMHELLHMASSINGRNVVYSGFSQIDKKSNILIGIGLTEGYTVLLDERYFGEYSENKKNITLRAYPIIKMVTSMLEDIISRETMEDLYFRADLKGLIDILTQYMSYEETISFIKAVDNIFYFSDNRRIPKFHISLFNYDYAIAYLRRLYFARVVELKANGLINDDEYIMFLEVIKKISRQRISYMKVIKSKKVDERLFNEELKEAKIKQKKKHLVK